jgi:hypothetical protein
MRKLNIASTSDPRLTDLVRNGAGEGYVAYVGSFEGQPAFVADCATLSDLLDQDDAIEEPVTVTIFDSEAERADYARRRAG